MLQTPNIVQAWLELIGTPGRAAKLLDAPWSRCPSEALFDAYESSRIYANPRYRPALDAWDTGRVVRRDIIAWCEYVRTGRYKGPRFFISYLDIKPSAEAPQLHLSLPPAA
jgi:hypothetical protein